jgi:hypothetical protein
MLRSPTPGSQHELLMWHARAQPQQRPLRLVSREGAMTGDYIRGSRRVY